MIDSKYNPREIEESAQSFWADQRVFESIEDQKKASETWDNAHWHAKLFYKSLLDSGVGKEQARAILPLSQYTEVYWTASFQAIMNFIELRYEKTAQVEIQEYAKVLLDMVEELFPEVTAAWKETWK